MSYSFSLLVTMFSSPVSLFRSFLKMKKIYIYIYI